jgi:hypothetical protein
MRNGTVLLAAGLAIVLVAGGGTALAASASSSPLSGGVITACYTNAEINGSHVIVLQNAGTTCPNGTTALQWSQTGPAGPIGATGSQGTQGAAGPADTITQLSSGNTNCPTGGAEIASGASTPSIGYACNGLPGASAPANLNSLDAMIGTPCDTADPANAGTLQVTYTPTTSGTDTISWVCSQSNPQYALTVTAESVLASEICEPSGIFGLNEECTYSYGSGTVVSSDGNINLSVSGGGSQTQTYVYPGGTQLTLPGGEGENISGPCTNGDGENTGQAEATGTCDVTMNSAQSYTYSFG